ncbi:MAG TPA: hypothetical protein VHW23_21160, partial [Kofleriaceae bacterium]|nr:hypothetical protein [Kofleriaceae bacterium]
MAFAVIGLAGLLVGALVGLAVCLARYAAQRRRFAAIVDVDAEVARLRAAGVHEAAQLRAATAADIARLKEDGQRYWREAQDAAIQTQGEAARLRTAAAQEAEAVQQSIRRERDQQATLVHETAQVRSEFERLNGELRQIEGNLEDVSFGLYRPQYKFDTPEQFKAEMDRVYEQQKEMVRA